DRHREVRYGVPSLRLYGTSDLKRLIAATASHYSTPQGGVDQPERWQRLRQNGFRLGSRRNTVPAPNARLFELPDYQLVEALVFQGEFLKPLEGDGIVVLGPTGDADPGLGQVLRARPPPAITPESHRRRGRGRR